MLKGRLDRRAPQIFHRNSLACTDGAEADVAQLSKNAPSLSPAITAFNLCSGLRHRLEEVRALRKDKHHAQEGFRSPTRKGREGRSRKLFHSLQHKHGLVIREQISKTFFASKEKGRTCTYFSLATGVSARSEALALTACLVAAQLLSIPAATAVTDRGA